MRNSNTERLRSGDHSRERLQVSETIIEKEITRFDIQRNGIEYEVIIEKRANDEDRPLSLTVMSKKNRKDYASMVTKDSGVIGAKDSYIPQFHEYFDNRIILNMKKQDNREVIDYVALSKIA
jgi:hypothetical protein